MVIRNYPLTNKPKSPNNNSNKNHIQKKVLLLILFSIFNSHFISNSANNKNNKEDNFSIQNETINYNNNNIDNINNIQNKIEKNILVLVFPGGKSHNFVMKELFDFSKNNEKKFKYNYHILVHNWDRDFWDNFSNIEYKVYGFGDIESFDIIFNSSLDLVREDPIFGYSKFNKAMIHILGEFMDSNLLEKEFRNRKFDMILTDVPNFLYKFLRSELKIPLSFYLSPPALPNLFYNAICICIYVRAKSFDWITCDRANMF